MDTAATPGRFRAIPIHVGHGLAGKHKNFIRFLGYVRPYTRYLILAILGGVVKFTVPLLVPQVTRHLLDDVFLSETMTATQKYRELFFYAGGMIAGFIFV